MLSLAGRRKGPLAAGPGSSLARIPSQCAATRPPISPHRTPCEHIGTNHPHGRKASDALRDGERAAATPRAPSWAAVSAGPGISLARGKHEAKRGREPRK